MQRQVLLLNASEEMLNVIDWRKAICLLISGKAIKPTAYDESYKIKTTKGSFNLPKAIMLLTYVYVPQHKSMPTRRNIFVRDKWTCQYCGYYSKKGCNLTIDHVTPRSRGGDSSWTNLSTACSKCNSRKGNKKPQECKMPLQVKPRKPSWWELHMNKMSETLIFSWERWFTSSSSSF
jgi:5-methylcytosine-specific restriction endonuclease McrA